MAFHALLVFKATTNFSMLMFHDVVNNNLLEVLLELGGNNAIIVADDADLDMVSDLNYLI